MQNSGYPCPGCGAPADLTVGCRSCGRGPDPVAAEVIRLDGEIAVLYGQVEQARRAYTERGAALRTAQQRRSELVARVHAARTVPAARVGTPAGPVGPGPGDRVGSVPVGPGPVGPAPVGSAPVGSVAPVGAVPGGWPTSAPGGWETVTRPSAPGGRETSTRTVQGLLFVLGGLLLGTAAVVFTAVAWASVGIVGRAAILVALTALTLAVPPVVARRGLRGTAETFAAVGLVLVLLDGYAAWTVDLAGVADWPGTRYAALAGGVSAAVAAGYGLVTRLAVPWFTALLVAQPVLPLLAVEARPDVAGWAFVLTGVALVDLTVLAALRGTRAGGGGPLVTAAAAGGGPPVAGARGGGGPLRAAGQAVAWLGYAGALLPAALCAVVALALGEVAGTPLLAGLPLLVVGVVLVGAALVAGSPALRAVTTALLVVVVAVAAVRPVAELRPSLLLLWSALVVLALTGAVRPLPTALRTGPRAGAFVAAGVLAQVTVVLVGTLAAAAVARSVPPWTGAGVGPDLTWGWQLPVAALLATVAGVILLPRAARAPVGVGGGLVAVLAVPAAWPAPWPAVVGLELLTGSLLLLAAVVRPGRWAYQPLLTAAAGAVLTGHALLVGLAEPVGAGTVLAGLILTGVLVAGKGRRAVGVARGIAGPALAVALLAVPALVAVALIGWETPLWWRLRGTAVAVALLPGALLAVRRHWPDLSPYAAGALAVALPVVALAPLVVPGDEPTVLYLASAVLVAVTGSVLVWPGTALRASGVGLAVAAVGALTPAGFQVLVAPYAWLGAIWSGAPDGVGLPTGLGPVPLSAGFALLVLLGAVAIAGGFRRLGRRTAVLLAVPVGAVAVPVLLAGAGAPWPLLPTASLTLGTASLLTAALTTPPTAFALPTTLPAPVGAGPVGPVAVGPGPVGTGRWAGRLLLPVLAVTGLLLAGAGLGGLLPTRASTLVGLGTVLVAAVVVGVAGRVDPVRPVGWVAASVAATGFAVTASRATGLPLRTAGFAVLGVAALTLATAALLARRRPVEGRVLDAAAQTVAVVALLLTVGALRHAAVVCTLWGVAVALRVLRPGESTGRRWAFALVAGGSEVLGVWLLLAAGQVVLLEAYTLPAAGLALLAGLVALRTRPGFTSWLALGPGLAAALLPGLVSVLVAPDPQPWRRLLLGVGALAVLLAGSVRRWQAPVVLGGVSLALLALHELVRSWDLVPRWIFLAVGGLALIALATTYERRRRDLARLRSLVGRMG